MAIDAENFDPVANEKSVEMAIQAVVSAEEKRAQAAEKSLSDRINTKQAALDASQVTALNSGINAQRVFDIVSLAGGDSNTGKSVRTIAGEEMMKLVDGAPDTYDTLKEIAEWIAKDETGTQAIVNQVAGLADEVAKKANTKDVGKFLQTKANIDDVLSPKESQNFTDDEKEIASVNGGYRYRLYAPEAEDETVGDTEYLKYSVKDYAINIILLDTAKPVRIHLPAPVDTTGRCRDFIVKLKVTSETIPAVEFVKNDADESIAFESSDEDWATIEAGINYFTFTETERVA